MFYPKKKKLGDLEVEEVAELFGIPRNGDEPKKIPPSLLTPVPRIPPETLASSEPSVPIGSTFYPKARNEENTTNFGQGRIIENPPTDVAQEEPGFYPRTRPRVVPATTDETFAPRSELSGTIREPTSQEQLEQEYEKRRQLQTVGAPKEKSLAKRLLQGSLRGFARGGIGGAMLGTAVEGFYPKANTNLRTETELAKSNRTIGDLERTQQFQSQQEMAKAQRDALLRRTDQTDARLKIAQQKNADTEYDKGFRRTITKLKLGYKKGENPQTDTELARYGIDIDQWDDNQKTFWQGQNYMTFDEKGNSVPVVDEKGNAVTDPTRAPVEVTYDGEKFTVSNTVAYQGKTMAGYRNTQIENQDIQDENDYKAKLAENQEKRNKIGDEVAGFDTSITELKQANNYKQNQITTLESANTGLDPTTYEGDQAIKANRDEIKRLKGEIEANDKEWRKQEADKTKKVGERDSITDPPKPQKRKTTTVPKVVPKSKDPLGLFQ